jgi:hypothetical protein
MTAVLTPFPPAATPGRPGTPRPGRMQLETAGRTYSHCLGPSPTTASSH